MKLNNLIKNLLARLNQLFFFSQFNTTQQIIWLLIFLIILEVGFIAVFVSNEILTVIILLLIVTYFIFTAFSVERAYYVCAAYFLIFPDKFYSAFFPGMPISFYWKIGFPLFIYVVFLWLIYLIKQKPKLEIKLLDKILIIFFVIIAISAVLGILKRYKLSYFNLEFIPLSLHISYFIFLYSKLKDNPKRFYDFIVLCTLIIAFEFIDSLFRFGGRIFLIRIVSMHIHMSQLAIPYLIATLIFSQNKKRKIIFWIILPFILLSVAISQQRALWGSTLVLLILLGIIYIYDRRRRFKENYIKILRISTAAVGIILFSYFVVNQITAGKLYLTILARGQILFNLESWSYDASYKIRTNEIKEALSTIKGDFLLGKGLGAYVVSRWRFAEHIWVDNSYAYIYWKMGIIGVIAFFLFYGTFFIRGIRLLRKNISNDERIFVVAALLNFVGLFIVGLTNVCIILYRFIIVWMASIAIVESIGRKYE